MEHKKSDDDTNLFYFLLVYNFFLLVGTCYQASEIKEKDDDTVLVYVLLSITQLNFFSSNFFPFFSRDNKD